MLGFAGPFNKRYKWKEQLDKRGADVFPEMGRPSHSAVPKRSQDKSRACNASQNY